MKISEQFFAAKKDKNISSLLIMQKNGERFIRLCIDEKSKYNFNINYIFVETEANFSIDNYIPNREIKEICFHIANYNYSPIRTFLDSIKKDSDVSFKIIAFNSSDSMKNAGFFNHKLFGIIDNKIFLLDSHTGPDNLGSPIR